MRVRQTETFVKWRTSTKDQRLRAIVALRIERLATGNPGDVRPVGSGISELRFDYGPEYRIYFQRRGSEIIVLLCGGDKTSQRKDILKAKALAAEWEDKDG